MYVFGHGALNSVNDVYIRTYVRLCERECVHVRT